MNFEDKVLALFDNGRRSAVYVAGYQSARAQAAAIAAEADRLIAEMAVENAELRESLKSREAELERVRAASAELAKIGELIRTQDNRVTDQPIFVVFQKQDVIADEDYDHDRICWVSDGCEVDDDEAEALESKFHETLVVPDEYQRLAVKEVDQFVTACFTEQGCRDYLKRNRHNLRKPFIYAAGSFRNEEYQIVRNWLAALASPAAGPTYRCHKCGQRTNPPAPYKMYVQCECGALTAAPDQ